nr:prepilin peptidase [Lachnospiraceae bacterium]
MYIDIVYYIFLGVNTVTDFKKHRIYVVFNLLSAVAGLIIFAYEKEPKWISLIGGIFIGAYLYLFSLLTKGAVGIGDSIVVAVSGIFLGGGRNATVLMGGLLLAGLCGGILLVCKKAGRKSELPFVPFFTLSYIILRSGGVL